MFNILIADDEELERKAILGIINTFFQEEFNVFEAKNGRQAIEIAEMEKPDIIIMDIKMPGIDGIEAIKEIRKFLKDSYIIVLTAYDYFNYAKEIMEYGVKDYLLKPLKRRKLTSKISNAMEEIKSIKNNRKKQLELKEKVNKLIPLAHNELCYAIISGNMDELQCRDYLSVLNLQFTRGYALVVKIKDKYMYAQLNEEEKRRFKIKLEDYIYNYMEKIENNCIITCSYTDNITLFVEVSSEYDPYNLKLNIIRESRAMADRVKEKFNASIIIGIGKIYENIENLYLSYKEALMGLDYSAIDMRVRHYEDIFGNRDISLECDKKDRVCTKGYKLPNEDLERVQMSIIDKSIEYINENYMKDLTLEKVASYVSVSPYYFTKIFKKDMGKSYIDYLTEIRIQRAKSFFKNEYNSVKDVCYRVGYNDPNYFSRVFKKIAGVSPTDYKRSFDENNHCK